MIDDFWYRIGIPGTMETVGDKLEEKEERKRQNRRNYIISICSLVIAGLSLIVTLLK